MPTLSEPSPPSFLLDSSSQSARKTMGNIFYISLNLDRSSFCCGCIDSYTKYLSKLREDLESLRSAFGRLREARNDVKGQIDMDEREQLQPLEQVLGWLSRVEALETLGNQLIGDGTGELQRKCLGVCCARHCRTQYKLGKKVAKLSKNVGQLIEEKPQSVAAERFTPPGVSERPCEVTVSIPSDLIRLEAAFMKIVREFWAYMA